MSSKVNYGKAQADFIKLIRQSIDEKEEHFFHDKDWRMLTVKGGRYIGLGSKKMEVTSFYVKPVAAWVPHLLIPGYVPSCPNCKVPRWVDCKNSKWITTPRILYGLRCHRYLDTKMYYCSGCTNRFAGYNLKTMEIDAKRLIGFFGFNLSRQFAIDEELYSMIVNLGEEATATIHKQLAQNVKDKYFDDFQYYLYSVRNNQVMTVSRNTTLHDATQATLDPHLQPIQKESEDKRNAKRLEMILQAKRVELRRATESVDDPIDFKNLLWTKKQRNARAMMLPNMGVSKLKKLISYQILNAKMLLQYNDVDGNFVDTRGRSSLEIWKSVVSDEYQKREAALEAATVEFNLADHRYQSARAILQEHSMEKENLQLAEVDLPTVQCSPTLPPMFSTMTDNGGYNARFLSMKRIDSVLNTEFQHRKPVQLGKMYGLSGQILKMDFNYKLAKKVRVWNGRGISFRPYKCIVTIQNEDGLTVFWKLLKGAESMTDISNDLKSLNQRLVANNLRLLGANTNPLNTRYGQVLAVYVDNCCNVSKKLQEIFRHAEIKLDAFHWLQRWNPEMQDSTSKQAGLFRSFMSTALFPVPPAEFKLAKLEVAKKLGREPTTQEVFRATTGSIPPPEILETRVQSVLVHCMQEDWKIDWQLSQQKISENLPGSTINSPPVPCKFFKRSKKFNELVSKQMSHIRLGCLSDPKHISVKRKDPRSGNVRTARGTNSNEADNLHLDRITGNAIGLTRSERLMWVFFERNNFRKQVLRLGEEDYGTVKTEVLALINSLARDIGYIDLQLPFPKASHPSYVNRFNESIGFDLQEPPLSTLDAEDDGNVDVIHDNDVTGAAATDITDDAEEDDHLESPNDITTEELLDDVSCPIEVREASHIAAITEIIAPAILQKKENTLESFLRVTGNRGWIPFNMSPGKKDALDLAEQALFLELEKEFNPNVAPSTRHGYKNFETLWNTKVYERFHELVMGDEQVVLIRPKSAQQLKEYYLHLKDIEAISLFVNESNPSIKNFNIMKQSRLQMPTSIPPVASQPIQFLEQGPRPFGTATLSANPGIGMSAIENRITNESKNDLPLNKQVQGLHVSSAPWILSQSVPHSVENPLLGYNYQKFCPKCGFRKKDHVKWEGFANWEGFGQTCTRNYCAKCNRLDKFHDDSDGKMGPYCRATGNTISITSPHNEWYRSIATTTRRRRKRHKVAYGATTIKPISVVTMKQAPSAEPPPEAVLSPTPVPAAAEPRNPVPLSLVRQWTLKLNEEQSVDYAMNIHDDENHKLVCEFGGGISYRSLKRLRPGIWLNDEVMNGYLSWITQQRNKTCQKMGLRKCHVYHSFFMGHMTAMECDGGIKEEYNYKAVKRWSRKVPNGNIFELDKLLIPINRLNVHWVLVVVDIQQFTIKFYDSYTEYNNDDHGLDDNDPYKRPDKKYLDLVEKYLCDEYEK